MFCIERSRLKWESGETSISGPSWETGAGKASSPTVHHLPRRGNGFIYPGTAFRQLFIFFQAAMDSDAFAFKIMSFRIYAA